MSIKSVRTTPAARVFASLCVLGGVVLTVQEAWSGQPWWLLTLATGAWDHGIVPAVGWQRRRYEDGGPGSLVFTLALLGGAVLAIWTTRRVVGRAA